MDTSAMMFGVYCGLLLQIVLEAGCVATLDTIQVQDSGL